MFKTLIKNNFVTFILLFLIICAAYQIIIKLLKSKNLENFQDKQCFRKTCSICRTGHILNADFKPCCYDVKIDCNTDNLLI